MNDEKTAYREIVLGFGDTSTECEFKNDSELYISGEYFNYDKLDYKPPIDHNEFIHILLKKEVLHRNNGWYEVNERFRRYVYSSSPRDRVIVYHNKRFRDLLDLIGFHCNRLF